MATWSQQLNTVIHDQRPKMGSNTFQRSMDGCAH